MLRSSFYYGSLIVIFDSKSNYSFFTEYVFASLNVT